MSNELGTLLGKFREIPGVTLAAVISLDGLVIESAQADGLDPDAVAAVAGNGLLMAQAIGGQLDRGAALQVVIEYESGILALEPVGDDAFVLIVSDNRVNLGRIRFAATQQRSRLQDALAGQG